MVSALGQPEEAERHALQTLHTGGLAAMPTETVYGLFGDATRAGTVARIFEVKGRPRFNPLIAHVADEAMARAHGVFDERAARLAAAFWPGPLTIVLERRTESRICDLATAGLETVALRVPGAGFVRRVIAKLGAPLAGPSANPSGRVSPTNAAAVMSDIGDQIDLVVDGGPCALGLESTVIACTPEGAFLLRPGGLPKLEIEDVLGEAVARTHEVDDTQPRSPGMLKRHYATEAPIRLDARKVEPGEAVLAFGRDLPPGSDRASRILNLSVEGDLTEAAAHLYAHLRALDASEPTAIAVAPIPSGGLGEAITDRLRRAAVPPGPEPM